jgi:hypothetical protein
MRHFDHFRKEPFKKRLKDTGYLLKNSFGIVAKDEDIKTPTIRMIVLDSLQYGLW